VRLLGLHWIETGAVIRPVGYVRHVAQVDELRIEVRQVAGLHCSEGYGHLPEPLHPVEQELARLRHTRDDPLAALVVRLFFRGCGAQSNVTRSSRMMGRRGSGVDRFVDRVTR